MAVNKLLMFTSQFPYGTAEEFISLELQTIFREFDEILLFPVLTEGEQRTVPSNVKVIDLHKEVQANRGAMSNPTSAITMIAEEFHRQPLFKFLKQIGKYITDSIGLVKKAYKLKQYVERDQLQEQAFYSYWANDWLTILCLLKDFGTIDRFYSRAHGFDLYEDRNKDGIIRFRKYQVKNLYKLIAVSKHGEEHLKSMYPEQASKFEHQHLGVDEKGTNPYKDETGLTIVSCSTVNADKRVELIIEALMKVTDKVNWIHFGGGEDYDIVKKRLAQLPDNVKVQFEGWETNEKIFEFYRENTVHLFVNVSKNEGIPVAMMDAISFGIPVVGTRTSGVPELVSEKTGLLLEVDFEPEELTELIQSFAGSTMNSALFREGVKDFWKKNFNSQNNYLEFVSKIKGE